MSYENPSIREIVNEELDLGGRAFELGLQKMIAQYLEENEFDGLINQLLESDGDNTCCGCHGNTLLACGVENCSPDYCKAAYLHKDGFIRLEKAGEKNRSFSSLCSDLDKFNVCCHCGEDKHHEGPCATSINTVQLEALVLKKKQEEAK